MNAALFKKILPQEYLDRYLSRNTREDGRGLLEANAYHETFKTLSDTHHSIIFRVGETFVLVDLKEEIQNKAI